MEFKYLNEKKENDELENELKVKAKFLLFLVLFNNITIGKK